MNSDLIIRVRYNDTVYDLDVLNEVPLRVDMSTVEAGELGRVFGIGSQTFTLPGTKNNNKFFKNAYDIGADNPPGMYDSIDAWVIQNGETLLYGKFQLIEVVTDEAGFVNYNVQIADKVIQFKEAIEGKFIKDGDWSAYTHTLTSGSIVDSWSGNLLSGSVFYPLAEYGRPDNEQGSSPYPYLGFYNGSIGDTLRPVQVEQFLPAVKVKDAINVIFDQVNFRATGSFLEKPEIDNLYMLTKANDQFGPLVPSSSATFIAQGNGTNELVFLGTTRDKVPVEVESFDPQNAYSTSSYEYTAQAGGEHTFNGSISFFNPNNVNGTVVRIKLELRAGSYPSATTIIETVEQDFASTGEGGGIGPFTLSVSGTTSMTPAVDNAWLEISYTKISGAGTPPSLVLLNTTGRQFRCTSAPKTFKGATVDMAQQFNAELKSSDIIKALITQFNLVMVPVYDDQSTIQIETFDDWMRTGGQKDWTNKYDTSKRTSITHTINELPKKVILTQAEDNDRLSKLTKEQEPYRQYGSLELFATSNNAIGEDKLETLFAPIILGGVYDASALGSSSFDIDTTSITVYPHLYKYENDKILPYGFKPRLGFRVNNNLPSGSSIYIGDPSGGNPYSGSIITGSYGTLSNLSQLPGVPGSTIDLHFNNTYTDFGSSALGFNDGIDSFYTYWKTYYDSLYWDDAKKITLDVQFDPYEYKNIKLNDKILIKNQYYRINKIKGFNISQRDVVTVELIRLYPAYYQPSFESGVYPSPTPPPSGVTPTPTPSPSPSQVTPTPSPTSITPTPTPSSGSFVTPTPTPSPTPSQSPAIAILLQISSGSVNQNQCGNIFSGSVYTSYFTPMISWSAYGQSIYTDSGLTTPFNGGNRFHRISDGTYDEVWSVNASGLVSVEGPNCAGITQFWGNSGYLTEGNECFGSTDVERYSADFADVNDIQLGDRIYANSSLTYELSDGWYYGLANSQSVDPEVAFEYSLISGVSKLGDCNAGIPVLMSSYAFTATDACQDTSAEFTAYVPQGSDPYNMPSGSRFYSNPQLTSGFGLNNLFYGAYSGSEATPVVWYELDGSDPFNGYVVSSGSCGASRVYSGSSDDGSTIGGEGCFNTPTQNIYMREPLEDIVAAGSGQFYENSFASLVFPGNSGRYSLHQSASSEYGEARAIFTINSSGVGTLYQNCGLNLYSFYGTSGQSLASDPCNAPLTSTIYTDEFSDAKLIQTGSRLYTNAQLSNELADDYLYVISNVSGSDGRSAGQEARAFRYNLIPGVSQILGSCSPTSSVWYGTSFTTEAFACDFTTPNTYYTSGSFEIFDLLGEKLYTNAGATIEITANNQWIGLGYNPSPATADVKVYYVSGSGISVLKTCAALPTPTPTSTPLPPSVTPTPSITPTPTPNPLYEQDTTSGQSIQGIVCGISTGADVLYSTSSNATDIVVGQTVYADTSYTPFNGGAGLGLYYGVGYGTAEVELRINSIGVVTNRVLCPVPSPTPSPAVLYKLYRSDTGFLTNQQACDSGSAGQNTVYADAPVQSLVPGNTIYTNSSGTTKFNGGDDYWFVEEEFSPLRFRVISIDSFGNVQTVSTCGVPDPTPTPTPTPTVTPSSTPAPSPTPVLVGATLFRENDFWLGTGSLDNSYTLQISESFYNTSSLGSITRDINITDSVSVDTFAGSDVLLTLQPNYTLANYITGSGILTISGSGTLVSGSLTQSFNNSTDASWTISGVDASTSFNVSVRERLLPKVLSSIRTLWDARYPVYVVGGSNVQASDANYYWYAGDKPLFCKGVEWERTGSYQNFTGSFYNFLGTEQANATNAFTDVLEGSGKRYTFQSWFMITGSKSLNNVFETFGSPASGTDVRRIYVGTALSGSTDVLQIATEGPSIGTVRQTFPNITFERDKWYLLTYARTNDNFNGTYVYIDDNTTPSYPTSSYSFNYASVASNTVRISGGSGYLTDFVVYTKALSTDEINQNYNSLRGYYESNFISPVLNGQYDYTYESPAVFRFSVNNTVYASASASCAAITGSANDFYATDPVSAITIGTNIYSNYEKTIITDGGNNWYQARSAPNSLPWFTRAIQINPSGSVIGVQDC